METDYGLRAKEPTKRGRQREKEATREGGYERRRLREKEATREGGYERGKQRGKKATSGERSGIHSRAASGGS